MQNDYRQVEIGDKNRALLDFARKVTLSPQNMEKADVDKLRDHGFSDSDISDAAQLIGYFNYTNRVMDCLGIKPETHMRYKTRD